MGLTILLIILGLTFVFIYPMDWYIGGSTGNSLSEAGGNPPAGGGGPNGPYVGENSNNLNQKDEISLPSTEVNQYNPSDNLPPQNKKDLYDLMRYKLQRRVDSGFTGHSVSSIFGYDSTTNNIAKAMLYGHILDNKAELTTAYRQIGGVSNPSWSLVNLSFTSPILISLARSF